MGGPEYTVRIGKLGYKTPDSMDAAVQELRAAGVPGNAKLVITGAQGGWAVTASWTKPPATEPGQEQNQGDRDTPPGFERE